MSQPAYFLGCPVWAVAGWKGSVFTANAPRHAWLKQYTTVFSTVEGNSTFYALPTPETAQRWADEAEPGFRFALKFPRVISHDKRLVDVVPEARAFLRILEILNEGDRLGPSFLQLPPDFGRREFPALRSFLKRLPAAFPYAVEVRHADYFDDGPCEPELDDLLRSREIDRVLFDSRALYSAPPEDEFEEVSQTRKPRSPLRFTVTARNPFVRIIGRNRVEQARPWLEEWAEVVAQWIEAGLQPYVFAHTPDDSRAAVMATTFHDLLRRRLPNLPPLPPWPGQIEAAAPRQQSLF